jgi:hypothetical protein
VLAVFTRLTITMSMALAVAVCLSVFFGVRDPTAQLALMLACLPQFFRAVAVPLRALLASEEQGVSLGYQELIVRLGTTLLILTAIAAGQGVLTMVCNCSVAASSGLRMAVVASSTGQERRPCVHDRSAGDAA